MVLLSVEEVQSVQHLGNGRPHGTGHLEVPGIEGKQYKLHGFKKFESEKRRK
jgi:hypothetical protein